MSKPLILDHTELGRLVGLSLAAQGLWFRMKMLMHDSPRFGYLCTSDGAAPMPSGMVAQRCGTTAEEYATLLAELDTAGLPSRSINGIVFDRRMVGERHADCIGPPKRDKHGTPPSYSFKGLYLSITTNQNLLLEEAFPLVDITAQYKKAEAWCAANEEKRPKKNFYRFMFNWCQRERPDVKKQRDYNETDRVLANLRGGSSGLAESVEPPVRQRDH